MIDGKILACPGRCQEHPPVRPLSLGTLRWPPALWGLAGLARRCAWVIGWIWAGWSLVLAQGDMAGAQLIAVKGVVDLSRAGSVAWDPAPTNAVLQPGDRLRTSEGSRATLRLRDATIVPVDELTTLRVSSSETRTVLELLRGVLSFFHRDAPGDVEVRAGGYSALIRGTEFAVALDEQGEVNLVLYDGRVEVVGDQGRIHGESGDVIHAGLGAVPTRSPGLAGTNKLAIQWVLQYPAVLDPGDVTGGVLSQPGWLRIVEAYRSGAIWMARDRARSLGEPATDPERLMQAALRLATGDVPGFERLVAGITTGSRESVLASAMAGVVEAVQFRASAGRWEGFLDERVPRTTTELLACSYAFQSMGRLGAARQVALRAVVQSPELGFAQVRRAEMEFALGKVGAARAALARGLELSPSNAAGVVLDGFLLASQGRFGEAMQRFDRAIQLDAALAEAWLGRGLVRFRLGDRHAGRLDLETAAALEPVRSVLRSYLAKAFAEEGKDERAFEELERARSIDGLDPTSWLYSALLHYRRYELGPAMEDLEESMRLNDNRAVYRSRLLLDQDAAVRGSNLANIYEMADMADVSRRESARAVMFDYASYSAHLNLASSYNALRDPTRFNLRNETVWFNEHLLASLLAPAGAAPLSQNLSQNEYSRLFARDVIRLNGSTEYFSSGEIRQLASQFGNFDRFSYALDLDYNSKPGFRPNQDLSRVEWYSRAKVEVGTSGSMLLLAKYQDYVSGDQFQYADPRKARLGYRVTEQQAPMMLGGYHHEWSPGSHTLLLGGRLENDQRMSDPASSQLVGQSNPPDVPGSALMGLQYRGVFEAYSAEACHILQGEGHSTVLGGRLQTGDFMATALMDSRPSGYPEVFGTNVVTQGGGDFLRRSAYLYQTLEVMGGLRITGGLAFDDVLGPANFRRPPLTAGERGTAAWSPKVALAWNPVVPITVRGLYAESVGGVSYDESVRLEPTQMAGFLQSFRTLISESLVGSVEMPRHRSGGLALDARLPGSTYVTLEGRWLGSEAGQLLGMFLYDPSLPPLDPSGVFGRALPDATMRYLDYGERGGRLVLNRVLAQEWFAQASYEFVHAELAQSLPALPRPPGFATSWIQRADMHRVAGSLLYQRPQGWFGRLLFTWNQQDNSGQLYFGDPVPQGDAFAQVHVFVGHRFPRHQGDITVGLLNLSNRNYALHPLTPFDEMPRERTIYVRLRFNL